MQTLEQQNFLKQYENRWVALTDDDKVVCSGVSLDEILKEAKRKGIEDPVTARIPDSRFEFIL